MVARPRAGKTPESEAARKAWRAGISPMAVFGRSGRPVNGADGYGVVRSFAEGGVAWYSPALPTWAFRDGLAQCEVVSKAVKKYGLRTSPLTLDALLRSAAAGAEVVPPTIEAAREVWTLDGKLDFVALDIGGHVYAAVPLAYVWRRWGSTGLTWLQTPSGLLSVRGQLDTAERQSVALGLIAPCLIGAAPAAAEPEAQPEGEGCDEAGLDAPAPEA